MKHKQKVKLPWRSKESIVPPSKCYYPNCKKKVVARMGRKDGWYGLCEEHYTLAMFIDAIINIKN